MRCKEDVLIKFEEILQDESKTRSIIAVSGIPGSGKTTFANKIVDEFNEQCIKNGYKNRPCIALSMDGFHLPKSKLDGYGLSRRGAHFTFDAYKLLDFLKQLKKNSNSALKAPSFDHKAADPIEEDITIEPYHRLIIVEGIYLHLKNPSPWDDVSAIFDEKWFIPISMDEARKRVAKRHYNSNLVNSIEEGLIKFDNNDMLNAKFILENRDGDVLNLDVN